jgi:hypothetical protein
VGSDAAQKLDEFPGDGDGVCTFDDLTYPGGERFYFLRATQSAGDHGVRDRAWIAPVWFEGPAPAPTPAVDSSRFVASRHSSIYHTDPTCAYALGIKDENRVTGAAAMVGRTPHVGCPKAK